MEIADIFVVNKCDRPDSGIFEKNLRSMLEPVFTNKHSREIIKTIATEKVELIICVVPSIKS